MVLVAVPIALGNEFWRLRKRREKEDRLKELDATVRKLVLTGRWGGASEPLQELLKGDYRGLRSKQESYKAVLRGRLGIEEVPERAPVEQKERETRKSAGQEAYWDRPALVIGLGETGYEVVRQTKARFVETYGSELPKLIQFLSVDTVLRAGNPVQVSKGISADLNVSEMLNLERPDIEGVILNIAGDPAFDWLIPSVQPNLSRGTKADKVRHSRKFGRLALFYSLLKGDTLLDRLEACIREVRRMQSAKLAREKGIRALDVAGLDVFIVSAGCDTVGSGMMIDLAYLVHHRMDTVGIPRSQYQITGMVVLPSALATVAEQEEKSLMMTFAFLRELDHHMKEASFSTEYPKGIRIGLDDAGPFRDCYLIGSRREQDRSFLSSALAEGIFLQVTSQLGWMLREGRELEPGSYSAMGVAVIVFPAQSIIEACACQLGLQFIEQFLDQRSDEEKNSLRKVNTPALDTLNKANLHLEALWARVGEREVLLGDEGKVDWDVYSNRVRKVANQFKESVREQITATVKSMIRARPQGLIFPVEYLEWLADYLAVLLSVLREEKEHPETFEGLTVEYQRELYDAMADVVEYILAEVISPMDRALRRSLTMLETIREKFEQQYDALLYELGSNKNSRRYFVTSADGIQAYFDEYAPRKEDVGSVVMEELFANTGYPFEWGRKYQSEVEEDILSFCRHRFRDIAGLSIEDAENLTAKHLNFLIKRANPLWEGDIPESVQRFVILGVGDATKELYRRSRHLGHFAQTNNVHRISCLYTVHNLSLSELSFYHRCKQTYESLPRLERAYSHCFPDLLDDDKERLVFALAHALGLIIEEPDGQYWLQVGNRVLGCNLAIALDEFLCQDHKVVKLTEGRIRIVEKKDGTGGMEEKLKAYLEYLRQGPKGSEEPEDAKDLDTRMKLISLIKQYLTNIQNGVEGGLQGNRLRI